MHVECPYCPKTWDEGDTTIDPLKACAHHIQQSQDHPDMSYPEALNHLISDDSAPETAGEGSGWSSTPGGKILLPHHKAPEFGEIAIERCPECNELMTEAGVGWQFDGEHDGEPVTGEAETGDYVCVDCGIVRTNDDKVITNVSN